MNHTSTIPCTGFDDPPPLALYVHIPWCVKKCPYCDFNSHAVDSYSNDGNTPFADYVTALLNDIDTESTLVQGRIINSVFIGGGTPSLMPTDQMQRLLKGIFDRLPISKHVEITMEVNPGTVEYSRLDILRASGINRLSFGAQSFDDKQLQQLGRIHCAAEIRSAIAKAKTSGFENVNIDLMHSLPGQTVEGALWDLRQAIALQPKHLSWYQLTIEPNTEFYSKPPPLPKDDIQADIYQAGRALLQAEGFEQYEISAYANPGRESLHNVNYWQFGDYLAVGAGAHGKVTIAEELRIVRYSKTRSPRDYLSSYLSKEPPQLKRRPIEYEELPVEFLMNALRLKRGVSAELFSQCTNLSIEVLEPTLSSLRKKGLLAEDPNRICTTKQGYIFLNDVLAAFI